jgi:hypothetical protein
MGSRELSQIQGQFVCGPGITRVRFVFDPSLAHSKKIEHVFGTNASRGLVCVSQKGDEI